MSNIRNLEFATTYFATMSTSQKRIVAAVVDGEPPSKMLDDVETIQFTIHNFEDRSQKRGECIVSPVAEAHGYKWKIKIYPRGCKDSSTEKEYISVYLHLVSGKAVAKYTLKVKGCTKYEIDTDTYEADCGWGCADMIKRKYTLNNGLEGDGSLIIECDIQIAETSKRTWYPKKLQRNDLCVELYESSQATDATFVIDDALFPIHTAILFLRASKLYEITNEWESDRPIEIQSMRKEVFKAILEFVYTVKTPELQNLDIAKELLVASDRYECVQLKLYVESVIVDKFLKPEQAAELLLFGDSHSCALLKEAAMQMFVVDPNTFQKGDSWPKIEESMKLMTELLRMQGVGSNSVGSDGTNEIDRMSVSNLRKELEKVDLELDGSREVLVNRLKTSRETNRGSKRQRRN